MNKFLKKALPVSVLSCLIATNSVTSVFAAPTELYGYRKMDLIEFHKTVYDKYGNVREFPKNKTFKTTVDKNDSTDANSSASKHEVVVAPRMAKKSVVAVSGASKGSKGGEKDKVDAVGGASGGFVAADVVFDFELISNAMILHNLGIKNESVERILNIWSTSTKTIVTKGNTEEGYDWEDYVNKAADAYANGKDLTFEEYTKLKDKKVKKLPPKAKYILEDGSFGTQITRNEIGGKKAPNISNDDKTNILNSDITLTYNEDEEWKSAIESIKIGKEDYNKKTIQLSDVKFEGNKIIIDKKYFKLGENVVTFTAKDYKTVVVTQFVYKDKVELTVKEGKLGQDVVLSSTSGNNEFLKDIKFINFNGRVLDKEKGEWKILDDSIVLSKELFNVQGDYKVLINTDNKYDLKLMNIKVTKDGLNTDGTKDEKKVLPVINPVEVNQYEDIVFNFEANLNWQRAITKIEKLDESGIAPLYVKLEYRVSDGELIIPQKNVLDKPGEYTLRIFADGYEPLDVTATVIKEHPEVLITYIPRVNEEVKFKINDSGYRWVDNLHEIFIDGKKLDKEQYHTAGNLVVIHENVITTPGNHSVVMKSKGFTNAVKQIAVLVGNGATEENNLKDGPDLVAKKDIVAKNEDVIVTTEDDQWLKELKIVQVNGNKVNDFAIKDKNITIPSKYFKEGNNTIEMLSIGYRKVALKVDVYKSIPNDVKAFEAKEGFDMIIDLGYDRDYKVNEVILNGQTLNENVEYELSPNRWIVIKKAAVKVGANEVTIKAERYADKTFNIEVKKKETPKPVDPKPQELESAKAMLWRHGVDQGTSFDIEKTNEKYTVDSIIFNGKEVKFTQDNKKITPDISSLEAGNYEIILKAKDYKDGKFSIKIYEKKAEPGKEGKPSTDSNTKPSTGEIKPAPKDIRAYEAKEGFDVNIDLGYDSKYVVNEVILNGVSLNKDVDYRVTITKMLVINKGLVKIGANEVVLKSSGYEDKTLNIDVKKKEVPKPVETKPVETKTEELKSAKAMLWIHGVDEGSKLNIDKTDENYEVESITFNGQSVDFTQDNRKITPDISSLSPGKYEIILKAKGYKDGKLTITIYAKKEEVKKEEIKVTEVKVDESKKEATNVIEDNKATLNKEDIQVDKSLSSENKKEKPQSIEKK